MLIIIYIICQARWDWATTEKAYWKRAVWRCSLSGFVAQWDCLYKIKKQERQIKNSLTLQLYIVFSSVVFSPKLKFECESAYTNTIQSLIKLKKELGVKIIQTFFDVYCILSFLSFWRRNYDESIFLIRFLRFIELFFPHEIKYSYSLVWFPYKHTSRYG